MYLLSIVKSTFSVLLPLILIEVYLRKIYDVNLVSCAGWWIKNSATESHFVPSLIAFIFLYFILFVTSSYIIQSLYVMFFGDTYPSLFLGNIDKETSSFVNLDTKSIFYTGYLDEFTYSFKHVFTSVEFIRDSGTSQTGTPVDSFSFIRILLSILFFCVFFSPLLAVIHTLAYPVMAEALGVWYSEDVSSIEAFRLKLTEVTGLHAWHLVVITIILFLILIKVMSLLPKVPVGEQGAVLPHYYQKGNVIEGTPVKLVKTKGRASTTGGGYRETDTGLRNLVIRFSEHLEYPVHITFPFDEALEPGLSQYFKKAIESKSKLPFVINEHQIPIFQSSELEKNGYH